MRFCRIYTVLICILLPFFGWGQESNKTLRATKTSEKISVDGKLDEPEWERAEKATAFIQNALHPGDPSNFNTEVSILYDNDAVYVGARLYDPHPDSILHQLSTRDDLEGSNTDCFAVVFDTYHDRQNGFSFGVTAAGVQADAKVKFDGYDYSWNAAWFSKTTIDKEGWVVEMKIPYSAIRFSKEKQQDWGINFYRVIRRYREKSFWSPVMPGVSNTLNQEGSLLGVYDIKSPIRLALFPYISDYAQTSTGGKPTNVIDGGLDIKYGLSEAFTLDMTLVPDFGQTLYDDKVLNLSPVEVRYNEKRYFFTEGLDLFNKNDLFYTRRVGGTPVNFNRAFDSLKTNEIVEKNPTTTSLYNATKVSGRTKGNLGIGFFNAVSAPGYAILHNTINHTERQIETSPLTNYNVLVLEQAFKHNSYISFINTNVSRKEGAYNADAAALLFQYTTKQNTYALDGSYNMSYQYGNGVDVNGFRYNFDLGKIKGNYHWTLKATTISDKFNPNDMGYLGRNNISYYTLFNSYNVYKPFWYFNWVTNNVYVNYNRVFNPDVFQSLNFSGSHYGILKNYLFIQFYWIYQPLLTNDYYEPRTPGRVYLAAQYFEPGWVFSSDYRKRFALDGELNFTRFPDQNRKMLYWSLSPRFRVNDQIMLYYTFSCSNSFREEGFVKKGNVVIDSIYFGKRNVNTIVNTLSASYVFNNRMSLSVNARHYWSQAHYLEYDYLNQEGKLDAISENVGNYDINFNSFNIYTAFIWQFRPGSELSAVYQNSIYTSGRQITSNYFDNFNNTWNSPQSNSLSLKVIYYLDYLSLRRKNS